MLCCFYHAEPVVSSVLLNNRNQLCPLVTYFKGNNFVSSFILTEYFRHKYLYFSLSTEYKYLSYLISPVNENTSVINGSYAYRRQLEITFRASADVISSMRSSKLVVPTVTNTVFIVAHANLVVPTFFSAFWLKLIHQRRSHLTAYI